MLSRLSRRVDAWPKPGAWRKCYVLGEDGRLAPAAPPSVALAYTSKIGTLPLQLLLDLHRRKISWHLACACR